MTAIATQLPPPVRSYLRRFELRRGLQRIVRRAGLALVLTLVWGLSWCLVDRVIALPQTIRMVLLCLNAVAVVAIVGGGIGRMLSRADWIRIARDIELREPAWREKLGTVTSRLLGPKRFSGSEQLLSALAEEVAAEARRRNPRKLLPWAPILRPWMASLVIAGMAAALLLLPVLDLPRLASRYAMPLAEIAPAATTRLFVLPGDVKIAAGDALRVRASAQRLEEGGLTLHVRMGSGPADEWMEQPMSSTPDGTFEARVSNLERDAAYFVTGGDARSDVFHATILRRPAVLAFRWTITYPPDLKLPQRKIGNDDGTIEAPVGSKATVDIEASEPLLGATLELGGQSVAMTATTQSTVRQATLVVRADQSMQIRLTSVAGVEGQFSGGRVRAIIDRPPIVEVDAVRVGPGKVLKISYEAADDFGLARVDAEVKTADGRDHRISIPLTGDPREQQGTFSVDLASISPGQEDIQGVWIRGEDRAGQIAVSSVMVPEASEGAGHGLAGAAPAASEPAQLVDPTGFGDAIGAYFKAIRGGR